ncbi:MAG: TonB-dependent receptor [Proteobacteria bacterium]|nr:TonB-dependent receptor [Pseudomonadota bacterium]
MQRFVWVFLAAFALAAPATGSAQEETAAAGESAEATAGIEEITVTARKKEESAQDTPISLSVMSAEDFEMQQIEDLQDLQYEIPNFAILQYQATSSSANIGMRGIGTGGFTGAEDNSVGVYIDGVYISRSVGLISDMYDMERAEVLRGPQGTLFGRNTTAGALALHTRKADGTRNGYVRVGFGDHGLRETQGGVGFPILGETLSGRIAWSALDRDGFSKSVVTGNDYESVRNWNFRGSLRWEPSEDVEVVLVGDRRRARDGAPNAKLREVNPAGSFVRDLTGGAVPGGFTLLDALQLGRATILGDPVVPFTRPSLYLGGDVRRTHTNAEVGTYRGRGLDGPFSLTSGEFQNDDLWGFALHVTVDFENFVLESVSGHRRLKADRSADHDGTPDPIFWSGDGFDHEAWQQEFQLTGVAFDDRLEWTGGVFYYTEETFNDAYQAVFPEGTLLGASFDLDPANNFMPPASFNTASTVNASSVSLRDNENYSYAGYVEGEWNFDERTSLTLGVRYTGGRREQAIRNVLSTSGAYAGEPVPAGVRTVLGFSGVNLPEGTPWTPQLLSAYQLPTSAGLFAGDCILGMNSDTGELIDASFASTLNNSARPSGGCSPIKRGFRDGFWSWNAILTHHWSDSLMTFAKATQSLRSGNHSARPTGIRQLEPTDEEKAVQFELGLKSQFLDDRLRLNASYYVTNFSSIITARIEESNGITSSISENAGRSQIQGVEFELTALPWEGLEIGASFGWNDTNRLGWETTDACCRVDTDGDGRLTAGDEFVVIERGDPEAGTPHPELQWSLFANYTLASLDQGPLAGDWTARVSYSWQDKTDSFERYFSASRGDQCTTSNPCSDPVFVTGFSQTDAYGLLNASLVWTLQNQPLELMLWGRNLTDEDYETGWIDFPFGTNISYIARPREYGMHLTYRWGE